ncbi:MAG TPA: class I SAM-dependent methyltransferase [Longimicrobium sp.]|nr:class I SAM-dependent methyltransferase [Longimicrobium sp.]
MSGGNVTVAEAEGVAPEFTYSGEELDALGEARNYYGWISSRFAPYLGERIVEVGAGIGTFTAVLLERRPTARVTAIEPAENNFPRLARRFAADPRVTAVHGYLDGAVPDASADAVVAVNVMEHVEDDAGFLRAAAAATTSGGHVLLFVPAVPALFGSLDEVFEHCRRYTRRELDGKLRAAGLTPVSVRYMNFPGMLAWWLWAKVLRRRTITDRDARVYDRWVVPLVRAVETVVPPPIGNGLLAIARKP